MSLLGTPDPHDLEALGRSIEASLAGLGAVSVGASREGEQLLLVAAWSDGPAASQVQAALEAMQPGAIAACVRTYSPWVLGVAAAWWVSGGIELSEPSSPARSALARQAGVTAQQLEDWLAGVSVSGNEVSCRGVVAPASVAEAGRVLASVTECDPRGDGRTYALHALVKAAGAPGSPTELLRGTYAALTV